MFLGLVVQMLRVGFLESLQGVSMRVTGEPGMGVEPHRYGVGTVYSGRKEVVLITNK